MPGACLQHITPSSPMRMRAAQMWPSATWRARSPRRRAAASRCCQCWFPKLLWPPPAVRWGKLLVVQRAGQVTFLYKLADGCCPRSYGVACARVAGAPPAGPDRVSAWFSSSMQQCRSSGAQASRRGWCGAPRPCQPGSRLGRAWGQAASPRCSRTCVSGWWTGPSHALRSSACRARHAHFCEHLRWGAHPRANAGLPPKALHARS